MGHLFTMLPFSVNNPALPLVPASDYKLLSAIENGAYEHWRFDSGQLGLTGLVNKRVLQPQSAAETDQPGFSEKWLSINGGAGKALLTDMSETSGQEDTVCAVFRSVTVSTGIVVPAGCITAGEGGAAFVSGAPRNVYLTYRGTNLNSTNTNLVVPTNEWKFLAVSRKMIAGGAVRTLVGGSAVHEIVLGSTAYSVPSADKKVALGCAYFASAAAVTLQFAEAIVFDRQLSAAEMSAVYERSKVRMSQAGISI